MCRNIKTLFNFEPPATEDEIHASALQFVRKLSGFNKPSQANAAAFERAVAEVSASARRLLASLHTHAPARDREIEAEKAKERSRCGSAEAVAIIDKFGYRNALGKSAHRPSLRGTYGTMDACNNHNCRRPARPGDPVRRGLSALSPASVEYWITRFRG